MRKQTEIAGALALALATTATSTVSKTGSRARARSRPNANAEAVDLAGRKPIDYSCDPVREVGHELGL